MTDTATRSDPTAEEPVEVDFDVIVIGAGVAGTVTAYLLAQQGHSALLIERGETPGSKNLSGGVLYTHSLRQVFPDFLDEAPIERRITRNYINFLNADSSVGIDYRDQRLSDPVNAVTVLRAKFDAWLGEKAEEAGVFVMPGVRVDRVLTAEIDEEAPGIPRVIGVQAGDDQLRAHVVVAADGVNSFIAQEVGLRQKDPLNHLAVGVKA
ncbi:MAG: FAD-dependent oxidoreductase, partial [Dermatophilaceae bacterium]